MSSITFYVEYNCKFIAMYKTIKGALGFISRRGLKDDDENSLLICDSYGNMYHPYTGKEVVNE